MHKNVKKIAAMALIAVMALMTVACGKKKEKASTNKSSAVDAPAITEAATIDEAVVEEEEAPVIPEKTVRDPYGVTLINLYKNYSDEAMRKIVPDDYSSEWVKGQDISSFEVFATDVETIPRDGKWFQELFNPIWESYENYADCKIGYTVDYDLTDGTHVHMTLLGPDDITNKDYIEIYLYDDVHIGLGAWYSHLESVDDTTLITSIKFTAGQQVEMVAGQITLQAFVYYDDVDFDENGDYTGTVSDTITVTNTAQ